MFTPLALIGGVFYIMHHIIVKTTLFLVSGVSYRLLGTYDFDKMGGLYRHKPFLALLFLIPAFSLAGMPPLSGFFAKFILVKAAIEKEAYGITAIALAVGLLTLYSMTKVWGEVFWKAAPTSGTEGTQAPTKTPNAIEPISRRDKFLLYMPIVGLAICTLIIGLYGKPIYDLAEIAAGQLMNPDAYIRAVLGGSR